LQVETLTSLSLSFEEPSQLSDEFKFEYNKSFAANFAKMMKAYPGQPSAAEEERLRDKCAATARKAAMEVLKSRTTAFNEMSSIEEMRKTVERRYKQAEQRARQSMAGDRTNEQEILATARAHAQLEMIPLLEEFFHQENVLPKAWLSVYQFLFYERMKDNKERNFKRPSLDRPEFSNLTEVKNPPSFSLSDFFLYSLVASGLRC
jgi:hypothetical protein